MKTFWISLMSLALLTPLARAEPVWKKSGVVSYLCGGVGAEEYSTLEGLKPSSSLAVLLTEGDRGAYLSDVLLTVSGARMETPLMIGSAGPLCIFRMPAGDYELQAERDGSIKTMRVGVGGKVKNTQIRFGG